MKNRILLVFPPYVSEALSDYQPIGISYIASYILHKNLEADVKLIDFTVEDFSPGQWRKELQDFAPEVVGISVLTLNYSHGRLIAQLTKEVDQDILVVMGGIHATAEPEECLNHCDLVVRGEGEATFDEILQGRKWETIEGLSYKRKGEVIHNESRERIKNLDELCFPAHHLFKMENYGAFPKWGIIGSRGCPYNCTFCCSPRMWGRITKFRSAENIVNEIECLYENFGVRGVNFFDDTINIPHRRGFEICDEIIKRGLNKKMYFECQIRANKECVSLGLLRRMKEANFVQVGIGIESGSQEVLNSMRKSLTLGEAREAIEMVYKAGIAAKGFFMVGSWDEGIRDVVETWRFTLSNNVQPAFSICTPFPGTVFYQILKEKGYISSSINWDNFNQSTPLIRTNKMSRFSIFIVYISSILLQLVLGFARGHNVRHTISRIISYAWNMIWKRRNRKVSASWRRFWEYWNKRGG